jgi:uncharacterized protein YjiS (DUF1127 family)
MRYAHSGRAALIVVSANIPCHMLQVRKGSSIREDRRRSKGNTMKTLITQLREAAAKRALYRRIRDEIAAMPRAVALDLGILPGDADSMARKAVWG